VLPLRKVYKIFEFFEEANSSKKISVNFKTAKTMKLLNILFLVTLMGQTVFAEAQTAVEESALLSYFNTVL
ncbi:unnamed protein product, partial [Scytosiphon promiscuus]